MDVEFESFHLNVQEWNGWKKGRKENIWSEKSNSNDVGWQNCATNNVVNKHSQSDHRDTSC